MNRAKSARPAKPAKTRRRRLSSSVRDLDDSMWRAAAAEDTRGAQQHKATTRGIRGLLETARGRQTTRLPATSKTASTARLQMGANTTASAADDTLCKPIIAIDPSQFCKDLKGRRHQLTKLRARRYDAVMSGMTFMRKFLQKNNYSALHSIGDDAPSIFFEIWYTSADSRIRLRAKSIMMELMNVYERKKVSGFAALSTHQLQHCVYL
jgi:hypothetical protein